MSRRPGFWSTGMTLVLLMVLVGLGLWQLQRRGEKAQLLAAIRAQQARAEVELPLALPNPADYYYRRVRLACTFTGPKGWLLGQNRRGDYGYRHLHVCRRGTAPPLLVDMGWSADKSEPFRLNIPIPVVGMALGSDSIGWIARHVTPAPVGHVYTQRDLKLIGQDLSPNSLPLLVVTDIPFPGLEPSTIPRIENIPNNHLLYALQWFGFAIILAIIYGLYRSRAAQPGRN